MPIRFRCQHCHQLMGIARRKAGTVVSCPTCRGQVVVPSPEPQLQQPQLQPQPAGSVFEQKDFDAGMFNPEPAPAPAASALDPATVPAPVPVLQMPYEHQPLVPRAVAPTGIVLTPARMAIVAAGATVLTIVAFVIGLIVGRWI